MATADSRTEVASRIDQLASLSRQRAYAAPPPGAAEARAATAAKAAAGVAASAGASVTATPPQRQHLNVPWPADAAAQIEDLLRQQDVPYALRISADVWLLDAEVPDAKRPKLIEPLRKYRLELPDDGKLRVRITQAR